MARAGFVLRFLKPCAVAACLVVLSACGGDGAPALPEVVRVTVAGMPDLPLAPMQTAQLTATATYSDGTVSNVTDTATWRTTEPDILTVSTIGFLTATGPGKADVSASFGGKSSYVSAEVVVLPAAYFVDGVEYAFEYQLDTKGRVSSYRISRRPQVDYGTELWQDANVKECTGDLYGSYKCISNQSRMDGEGGLCLSTTSFRSAPLEESSTYSYGQYGLDRLVSETTGLGSHRREAGTATLTYDAVGRLREVLSESLTSDIGGCFVSLAKTTITLDSQGRLSRAESTPQMPVTTCSVITGLPRVTRWSYSSAGFMKQAVSTTTDAQGVVVSETVTRYEIDDAGWLIALDGTTYAVMRAGVYVAEEQFTQAEPAEFYIVSRPQRIRYEWSRLPTEPLFVPRALTGLKGADYFGIISSHHR